MAETHFENEVSNALRSVHLKEYVLVIVEHTPQSAEDVSVSCTFYVNFGQEEKPGAKHNATAKCDVFQEAIQNRFI